MAAWRQSRFGILTALIFGVCLLISPWASAQNEDPGKLINTLFEKINERLNAEQDKIAADKTYLITIGNEMLAPYVSFETMAKQILGKNWRKITPDQRRRYTDAFRERVSVSMVSQYDPTRQYDLNVTGSRTNDRGDRAAVSSVVTDKSTGEQHNISYKLYVDRETGNWQVYDVVVEGVSVLQSFKTASAQDFKQNGIEHMIAQLENGSASQQQETANP